MFHHFNEKIAVLIVEHGRAGTNPQEVEAHAHVENRMEVFSSPDF